jgi:predicted ArsR family transcriptional regulator
MADVGVHAGTRERLLSLLHERGPSTTTTLADLLELSAAGVRRHLDALLAEGTVTHHESRSAVIRGRGRPAKVWALTEAGHEAGPAAYDDLAADALRFLAEHVGEDAVRAFADQRVAELEDRYRDVLEAAEPAERPQALAAAMTADGYAAGTQSFATGIQLCQHHCPVQHVAREFPQFCDAETAAIGRLLDVHVQRLATIAHGDGVCTTHIPHAQHVPHAQNAQNAQNVNGTTRTDQKAVS